ncbi:MAG: ethanolamine ammonia-lyase reactivating factor EutA [Clostridiales bacterium]|nr:ethanolamine ammonia-lyase reactivating factor EutA [Clostridiales bacterium]
MRESILSVGIDIGTSTTQLIFSRIILENKASGASVPRIQIVGKEIIYRSRIYFTPLLSQSEIDTDGVMRIIKQEYKSAGLLPEEIGTGAVIITGETARKENAAQLLQKLSGFAGDFVVATAGPDLEAILAGKGAGAEQISKDKNCTVMNLDIGGGTTNIAVFNNGEVIDTTCLDIGGRLIRFNRHTGKTDYVSPKIKKLADEMELNIGSDRKAEITHLKTITRRMSAILEEAVGLREKTPEFRMILTTRELRRNYSVDFVTFSGGVADYIYDKNEYDLFRYGDIGILLAQAVKESRLMTMFTITKPLETLNATVVGAGSYSMEISGSTITFTQDVFPLKNIPIIKMTPSEEQLDGGSFVGKIREKVRWFYLDDKSVQLVAIAIKGIENPTFLRVRQIAERIISGMEVITQQHPLLIVVVEHDMAKVLGQTLYRLLEYKKEVVCIDDIKVDNGDYIDIGKPLANNRVVPVVVKTLVFNS